jgi:hypothetical protein
MSKKNNVNPNHYKTGGRDRQGEDILQEVHKQEYAQAQAKHAPNPKQPFPASQQVDQDDEDGEMNKAAEQGK